MDGEVAKSVFEPTSPASEREATRFQINSEKVVASESPEESAVQDRLEDLGYL